MPTLASGLRISSQLGPVETIPQTHRGPHGLSMIRSVKRAIVGMSGDPSNIRLMFVYRRARRVRWRLPPPPPSPPDARTPGSRGANSAFFFEFQVIAADLGRVPKKTRRGRGKAAASVQRIVLRTGFRGPGLGASADSGGRRFGLRNPERSTGSRCAYASRHPRYPGVIPCYPGYKTFDRAQGGDPALCSGVLAQSIRPRVRPPGGRWFRGRHRSAPRCLHCAAPPDERGRVDQGRC